MLGSAALPLNKEEMVDNGLVADRLANRFMVTTPVCFRCGSVGK